MSVYFRFLSGLLGFLLYFGVSSQSLAAVPLCEQLHDPIAEAPMYDDYYDSFERTPAQANMCVVHVNYDCNDKKNDSCLDKGYCQKVKNWCFVYTKQSVTKFNTEDEIRKLYKEKPSGFAPKTNINAFVDQWKRCKSGAYAAEYSNAATPQAAAPKTTGGAGAGNSPGGNGNGNNDQAIYSGGLGSGEGY